MKRSFFISCVAIGGLLLPSLVMAGPNTVQIGFSCPKASGGGFDSLTNFGDQIAGYGLVSINSVPGTSAPFFSYPYTSGHFPTSIEFGGYSNAGVGYNPTNGMVVCKYNSVEGYDAINAGYQMTNGIGGVILSQNSNTIVILQYIGLKSDTV